MMMVRQQGILNLLKLLQKNKSVKGLSNKKPSSLLTWNTCPHSRHTSGFPWLTTCQVKSCSEPSPPTHPVMRVSKTLFTMTGFSGVPKAPYLEKRENAGQKLGLDIISANSKDNNNNNNANNVQGVISKKALALGESVQLALLQTSGRLSVRRHVQNGYHSEC